MSIASLSDIEATSSEIGTERGVGIVSVQLKKSATVLCTGRASVGWITELKPL